ncbi:MAG: DUF397 domain-containing protein [Pseudonocardiales bacterium]|nr:DUF397 domain-containing protein [Pseudonocardiales bacterium]
MTAQLRHPAWRKSSYNTTAVNCVEVAALGGPAERLTSHRTRRPWRRGQRPPTRLG